jgi:hypothetical protein
MSELITRNAPSQHADDGYEGERFWGPWAARVNNNNDPDKMGRLEVIIPQVTGAAPHPNWAWPMATLPGAQDRGSLWLPENQDSVWVIFEHGNPNYPTWSGGWHAKDELHADLQTNYPSRRGLVTKAGHQLVFDDTNNGQVIFKHGAGYELTFDDSGSGLVTLQHKGGLSITIDTQKVKLGGGGFAAPKFPMFEADFATAWNKLLAVLNTGTTGTAAAQQLKDLPAALDDLKSFGKNLANKTYESTDVENS